MRAEELLRHYNRVADAPGAITRLRRFVLQLAVRGKLLPQFASDEQTVELLERPGDVASASSSIPPGWLGSTVGKLLDFKYGKGLASGNRTTSGPTPVFGSNGVVGFTTAPLTDKPSIIVGRKGSAGALNICDGPSWTTDVAYYVEPPSFFDLRYLYFALSMLGLDTLGKGVKPGLARSDAYELELCVPPLAEQHRIVAKVDELMALCDRLEVARAEREAARDRLAAAGLARLNTPDPETFGEDARFVLDALPALVARPEQVKQLRQTILNLAVSGKLVDQIPGDEPASQLLRRVRGGKAPHAARVPGLGEDDRLPASWVRVELSEIAHVGTGLTPSRARPDYFDPPVIPWVTSGETGAPFVSATAQHVSPTAMEETSLKLYPAGTLLVAMYGQGKTRGQVTELLIEATTNQACAAVVLKLPDAAHRRYIKLYFEKMYDEIRELSAGGAQPNLNVGKIKSTAIPLPPLSEQARIVAKVDELMALCDRLEGSMASSEEHRRRLLDAVLHEALNPGELEKEAE